MAQYVGVDLGAQKTMVVRDDAEIVRTETGSISTPTLVSFNGKNRYCGEEAFAYVSSESTIPMLNTLLGKSISEVTASETFKHRKAPIVTDQLGRLQATINYTSNHTASDSSDYSGSTDRNMHVTALLGMYLASIWHRVTAVHGSDVTISFAIPPSSAVRSASSIERAYREASEIAGIPADRVHTVDGADCLVAAYARKLCGLGPAERAQLENKYVLIVEMGHMQSTALVVQVVPSVIEVGAANEDTAATAAAAAKAAKEHPVEVRRVALQHDDSLGAFHFDVRIFDALAAEFAKTNPGHDPVTPGSKRGFRLLHGCEKLRKLLSQLGEGRITVERLCEDSDSNFSMRREELTSICSDLLQRMRNLIDAALAQAAAVATATGLSSEAEGESKAEVVTWDGSTAQPFSLAAVEVLGGGVRMQVVQNVIHQAVLPVAAGASGEQEGDIGALPLGAKLDDATMALGAALVTRKRAVCAIPLSADPVAGATTTPMDIDIDAPPVPPTSTQEASAADSVGLTATELASARAEELRMQAQDSELRAAMDARNSLEAYILEMRSAPSKKHGDRIDRSKLSAVLDEFEGWMWDHYEASLAELQSKNTELRAAVEEICREYLAATEAERVALEKSLEEESARAAAEKAAEGGEEEDHDTRKLKKPDRMRLVVKNKDEGTELFKDKNYRPAAARYHKALTHSAKFFDLSPEDVKEVDAIKVSLFLNLATCYVKLENWDQVLRNCEEALKLDDKNVKAYFRRSAYYEHKKDWQQAQVDVKQCQKLLQDEGKPEDKLINQAAERIKRALMKEKEKEKKTWGKMFA